MEHWWKDIDVGKARNSEENLRATSSIQITNCTNVFRVITVLKIKLVCLQLNSLIKTPSQKFARSPYSYHSWYEVRRYKRGMSVNGMMFIYKYIKICLSGSRIRIKIGDLGQRNVMRGIIIWKVRRYFGV
jgi:hypothetical protein